MAVAAVAIVNIVVPARHYLYAGDVTENEAGYYGSLRVMLTEKTGTVRFVVTDTATGTSATVDPDDVFEPWQVGQLASRVDLLITAAQIIAEDHAVDGHRVEVRADAWISINGHPRQRTIDPNLDLTTVDRRPR